jgi:hypothetical protein
MCRDAQTRAPQLPLLGRDGKQRGVNPERCSAGQNRLPGLPKWWPVSALTSPGYGAEQHRERRVGGARQHVGQR